MRRSCPILRLLLHWIWWAGGSWGPAEAAPAGGQVLYGFETAAEFKELLRDSTDCTLAPSRDVGVTEGQQCARLVVPRGAGWAEFQLGPSARRGWAKLQIVALDLYADQESPAASIALELWDPDSKDYASRFTSEAPVRPGRQTLTWRVDRARRNRREAMNWEELVPTDKIDLDRLVRVKIIIGRNGERDQQFWIDNLRLLQEQDLYPSMNIALPSGAVGFDLGTRQPAISGLRAVTAGALYVPVPGWGMMDTKGLADGGGGWPDPLCGTYVWAPDSHPFQFQAVVPDGEYLAWLCAGPVIRPHGTNRHFVLKLNDQVLVDQNPSAEEFGGEGYLYRFLATRYSMRADAVREDYVRRMYPVWRDLRIGVRDGMIRLTAQNCFVSALVLVPGSNAIEYARMAEALDQQQKATVEKTWRPPLIPSYWPVFPTGTPWQVFIPEPGVAIKPWTRLRTGAVPRGEIRCAAAAGENVFLRVAVTGWNDAETGELTLSALQGPTAIPATRISSYVQNYRAADGDVTEMCLFPGTTCRPARGQTACFWLWLRVPESIPSGQYRGLFSFKTPSMASVPIPVELEIYPFRLVRDLPAAFGMYYSEPGMPPFPESVRRPKLKEQVEWMRRIGFTSIPVGGPTVTGGSIAEGGGRVTFDSFWFELARETGMARNPDQRLMANALGLARGIGKRLPGMNGAMIDREPGLELRQPDFLPRYKKGLREYGEFLERMGMPVVVEVVDEPREMPNPWNRNLRDTLIYAGLLREAGISTFVTAMGDTESGLDYTELSTKVDVVSTHGGEGSAGLRARTAKAGKTLWLYNLGLDRLSWGFFPWRCDARGRWEWHFCWPEDTAWGGYPGREWYNPFTGLDGLAPSAPSAGFYGGMLFKSAFFHIAEGITDYAYLCTLEQAIARQRGKGQDEELVRNAENLLEEIRKAVPRYLSVGNAEAGGIAEEQLNGWRARIAEQLKFFHKRDRR